MNKKTKEFISYVNHLIATFFYFGYAPVMPGTIGALGGVIIYLLLVFSKITILWYSVITIGIFILGVFVSDAEEKKLHRKDASEIVIDEVASILITMYLIPFGWKWLLVGFVLNRILDIVKPFPANRFQRLSGGIGIMVDDLVSSIYSNILLRIIILLTVSVS